MGEDVQEEAENTLKKFNECELCGHIQDKNISIAPEDLKEFIRSILGARVFIKIYKLYDGEYKLAFKTLTAEESSRLSILLSKLSLEDLTEYEKQQIAIKIKLVYYTHSICGETFSIPKTTVISEVLDKYDEMFKDENTVSLSVKTLIQFLTLQKLLIEEGYDANFWKSAGMR